MPASLGPVYFNADVSPDPTLTSTSVDGGVLFGNLAAGSYTITGEQGAVHVCAAHLRRSRTTSRSTSRRRPTPRRGRTTRRPASPDPPTPALVYPEAVVGTQDSINLIACVGELAIAALVALRALAGPLATPLMLLSVDFFVWNFAQIAYHRSGLVEWHLLDMVASPIATALAFDFQMRFLGALAPAALVDARRLHLLWGAGRRGGPGLVPAARPRVHAVADLELAVARRSPGLFRRRRRAAGRSLPARGNGRRAQPHAPAAGGRDGDRAAGLHGAVGRPWISRSAARGGGHLHLHDPPHDGRVAVPAVRPGLESVQRPVGDNPGRRRRGSPI